jgi:proliferating cell nuclear antigen PCNA
MKLEATTIQSHHVKQFFSSLKEQISDTDLECTPEGIRILSIDTTHIVCVHAELYATSFEHYQCEESFNIGIDVMSVNKILKHIVNGDILTLFVNSEENDDYTGDCLGIKIKNDQKAEDCVFYIDAIDTNVDKFRPEDLNYSVSLSIPSSDLQSIISKLKNTGSETLQLIYKNGTLTFIAKGDVAKATINRHRPGSDNNLNGITIKKDDNESLITVFLNINKVSEFTKCTNLSQFVTLFLQTDNPVFFEYQIGSLGKIRLGLSPRTIPENW